MDLTNWLDEDNFTHLHIHPAANQSENPNSFSADINLYQLTSPDLDLRADQDLNVKTIRKFKNNRLATTDHFSHDEMSGLYSLCITNNNKELLKKLPICGWNGGVWLHPRDIAYYNLIKKENLWALPLFVLVLFLALVVSFAQPKEKTSGKRLWNQRLKTLKRVYTSRISHFFINSWEKLGLILARQTWSEIFHIYFTDQAHPIHKFIGGEK